MSQTTRYVVAEIDHEDRQAVPETWGHAFASMEQAEAAVQAYVDLCYEENGHAEAPEIAWDEGGWVGGEQCRCAELFWGQSSVTISPIRF